MILDEMKTIIKFVMELDIDTLETFRGYHGDSVLKITLRDPRTRDEIDHYLEHLRLKYKNDYDITQIRGGAYSIFVGIEDPDIYKLKE